jgi:hypothetical protein
MSTAAVFFDIEKAFDATWQPGLFYKLSKLQYSTSLIKLIGSFLSQRKLRVSVEGEISTPRYIQAGVPQSSVLSPTLYNLYINDDLLSERADPSVTALVRTSNNSKLQTRPLVREGATK